jgi:hypothetical protein
MEDGGHSVGRRGGEHRCEAVTVDHAATVWTLLRVESDFPEWRQQSNERNMKTSAGEKLLGHSECRDPRQPERPVDWTRV